MKLSILMPVRNGEKFILKALQSIPERDDIETIIIDDCSEDGTYEVVKLFSEYTDRKITLIKNQERKYCGGSLNVGIENAKGEYVLQLDSDDRLNTENLWALLDQNNKEDLIFFLNEINDGRIFSPKNKEFCDHMCLYKRSLIGDTRYGNGTHGQGRKFHNEILAKPHTEFYSSMIVYYYNFPRQGSTLDLKTRGLL